MNRLQITGNITRDIEIRYTNGGLAIASFGIAWNENVKQEDGSYDKKAHYFNVTAFGRKAEVINQHFRKGSPILIDGQLSFSSWTGNDGQKRNEVSIKLNDFDFMGGRDSGNASGGYHDNGGASQAQQSSYQGKHDVPEIDINEDEIPF